MILYYTRACVHWLYGVHICDVIIAPASQLTMSRRYSPLVLMPVAVGTAMFTAMFASYTIAVLKKHMDKIFPSIRYVDSIMNSATLQVCACS